MKRGLVCRTCGVCSVCFRLIIGQILPDRTIRKAKAHVLGGQATRPSETIAPDIADSQSLAPGAKNRAKEKKNMASPEPVRLLEKPAYAYCTVSSSKMEDHMQKVCTGIHPMAHAQGWLATLISGCGRASCLGEFSKEMAIGMHVLGCGQRLSLPSPFCIQIHVPTFLPPLFETSESQNCVPWIYASGPAKG
jgi:hypothetical protein